MADFDIYKQHMEIDYYTYFAKAYFAFNHYIKSRYKGCKNDRERINAIKKENSYSKKFKNLMESNIFSSHFLDLRTHLSSEEIKNEEEIISFNKVKIQAFEEKTIEKGSYCGVRYFIKMQNNGKIVFSCGKSEQITCEFQELEQKLGEKPNSFTQTQKNRILSIVKKEFDSYIADVIPIISKLDTTQTLNEEEYSKLFKAFIEIMYLLRNALFHSEINLSNKETHLSYEKAYFLLREFVKKLS